VRRASVQHLTVLLLISALLLPAPAGVHADDGHTILALNPIARIVQSALDHLEALDAELEASPEVLDARTWQDDVLTQLARLHLSVSTSGSDDAVSALHEAFKYVDGMLDRSSEQLDVGRQGLRQLRTAYDLPPLGPPQFDFPTLPQRAKIVQI